MRVIDIVNRVGKGKQNIVYCNARVKVVKYAKDYADSILPDAVDKKYKEKLESLAKDIRNEVHSACFLAELVQKGVAYHVGYLPASIRLRIEEGFKDGMIRTMFCTSTLVEGVNLPADNLFITSYKNGRSDMNEVEFRNLVRKPVFIHNGQLQQFDCVLANEAVICGLIPEKARNIKEFAA